MPCIWGTHNRSKIFLEVGIIDASTLPANVAQGATLPSVPIPRLWKALVDTGAEVTMISPNVASTLGLSAIGQIPRGTVPSAFHSEGE